MLTNRTEFWLMNNPFRRISIRFEARKLKRMSPNVSFNRVLEVGCGEGQGTKNIHRYFNPKFIDAVDLDPKMIRRARRRVPDERAKFYIGDAANLSFARSETYDAVFDFGIIHHIPNWQDCLKELHRVLKKGGYVYIEDGSIESFTKTIFGRFLKRMLRHPYERMYTKNDFEKELQQIGFMTVKQSYLKPFLFWKILKK